MSQKNVEHLQPNEVVFVEEENALVAKQTFQVVELVQSLLKKLGANKDIAEDWTLGGIDCKVLKLDGGGWIEGKIKLTVELYPDQPEIPQNSQDEKNDPDSLDDLRKELNQDNS